MKNNNIRIFVANIIPAFCYASTSYLQISEKIKEFITEEYSNDPFVIPLDIQQYGHSKDDTAYSCGHLSAYGYLTLAQDYKNYISWYINNNKSVFRKVQFIGTTFDYTSSY